MTTDTEPLAPVTLSHEQLVRRVLRLESQLQAAERANEALASRVMVLEMAAERPAGTPEDWPQ